MHTKHNTRAQHVTKFVIIILLGQTLFFKFTAHPESQALFTQLNAEPRGRILTGILEWVAILLLLYPKTTTYWAWLALATMIGAIISHIIFLGIDDLFFMAIVVGCAASYILYQERKKIVKA